MYASRTVSTHGVLTVSKAATRLRLSPRSVRHLLETGVLAGVRTPHHWRVPEAALEGLVERMCTHHACAQHDLTPSALLTVEEVAKLFRRSVRAIRLNAEVGRIPAFKIGRAWRFWRVDIESSIQNDGVPQLPSKKSIDREWAIAASVSSSRRSHSLSDKKTPTDW